VDHTIYRHKYIVDGIMALRDAGNQNAHLTLYSPEELAAFGIALGASFPALGNGVYSTITSLCRQLIALHPAAYLLSLSGNVTLVWWAFPIAEVISVTVTLLFFRRIYRQKVLPLSAP